MLHGVLLHGEFLHSTAFAMDVCRSTGEMLWNKFPSANGDIDRYTMCYAPGSRSDELGVGHVTCDDDTYFAIRHPKFCCRNPRLDLKGRTFKAADDLCADVKAEYDDKEMRFRYIQGSEGSAPNKKIKDVRIKRMLRAADRQREPGFKDWRQVAPNQFCAGNDGTLITFPDGRAELCPTGSNPVRGPHHRGWACDGSYEIQSTDHCCMANGRVRCANDLVDSSGAALCNCPSPGESESSTGMLFLATTLAPLVMPTAHLKRSYDSDRASSLEWKTFL